MGVMNERLYKATQEMRKCNDECKYNLPTKIVLMKNGLLVATTRKSVRELENYKEIDKFNS